MKLFLLAALAALALALPGSAWAPLEDDGGSAYCQASMQGQTGYIHGWPVRCQAHFGGGGIYDPYYGWMFGCGGYFGCYAWIRY